MSKTKFEKLSVIDRLAIQLTETEELPKIILPTGKALDFASLNLKLDHERRPFWVTPVGRIFLEAFSPLYETARDFLIAICEPVSRPDLIHEYRLDKNALFAAASMGMTGEIIVTALNKMSKCPLPEAVENFILACTSGYGKVKIVLKRGRYFVGSSYPIMLRLLMFHPAVRSSRIFVLPNGKVVVGDSVEMIDYVTNLGLESENALLETESSLGLSSIYVLDDETDPVNSATNAEAEANANARGAVLSKVRGDTHGGSLVSRLFGEVDDDEIPNVPPAGAGTKGNLSVGISYLSKGHLQAAVQYLTSSGPEHNQKDSEIPEEWSQLSSKDIEAIVELLESAKSRTIEDLNRLRSFAQRMEKQAKDRDAFFSPSNLQEEEYALLKPGSGNGAGKITKRTVGKFDPTKASLADIVGPGPKMAKAQKSGVAQYIPGRQSAISFSQDLLSAGVEAAAARARDISIVEEAQRYNLLTSADIQADEEWVRVGRRDKSERESHSAYLRHSQTQVLQDASQGVPPGKMQQGVIKGNQIGSFSQYAQSDATLAYQKGPDVFEDLTPSEHRATRSGLVFAGENAGETVAGGVRVESEKMRLLRESGFLDEEEDEFSALFAEKPKRGREFDEDEDANFELEEVQEEEDEEFELEDFDEESRELEQDRLERLKDRALAAQRRLGRGGGKAARGAGRGRGRGGARGGKGGATVATVVKEVKHKPGEYDESEDFWAQREYYYEPVASQAQTGGASVSRTDRSAAVSSVIVQGRRTESDKILEGVALENVEMAVLDAKSGVEGNVDEPEYSDVSGIRSMRSVKAQIQQTLGEEYALATRHRSSGTSSSTLKPTSTESGTPGSVSTPNATPAASSRNTGEPDIASLFAESMTGHVQTFNHLWHALNTGTLTNSEFAALLNGVDVSNLESNVPQSHFTDPLIPAAAAGGGGSRLSISLSSRARSRNVELLRARGIGPAQARGLHTPNKVEYFEISPKKADLVRKTCAEISPPLPLLQEYDFRDDSISALPLLMDGSGPGAAPAVLRDPSALRPYQSKSLAKMLGNGRARSGIIVLPCGAGKTLVGIAACVTVGRSCMVLCPNTTSVNQWMGQFRRFTTIGEEFIVPLTSAEKGKLPPEGTACVLLTTYAMISAAVKRSADSERLMKAIEGREWGVQLLDEVHQAVATTFQRVLALRCHCRLGLTATLVREDGRDVELSFKIGPKLYEANWMDLTLDGYLANVQIVEIHCPMYPSYYKAYLGAGKSVNLRKALAELNPIKLLTMDYFITEHRKRKDKIIVFSESIFVLRLLAQAYNEPLITGDTPQQERDAFIGAFRNSSNVNLLFLSKVGDVALDVPDANVIIQISSHYGSRLQEAQRLGRILRTGTKVNPISGNNSFFYSLVSMDTLEMHFANKRRRYLVDQGYAYKLYPAIPGIRASREEMLAMSNMSIIKTPSDCEALLQQHVGASDIIDADVLNESKAMQDVLGDNLDTSTIRAGENEEKNILNLQTSTENISELMRTSSSLSTLSGGSSGLRYIEIPK